MRQMPRSAFLGDDPKLVKVLLPKHIYEWLKKKAEEDYTSISRVVRSIIAEKWREEMWREKMGQ